MIGYALTPQARADLSEIWTYIAEDNELAADKVANAIREGCSLLADGPWRGHTRQDLTNLPLRFWTLSRYRSYVIVYRPETKPLQIVAILHGRRDIQRVLKGRG
jgi:plasmid stabilization system protein ParE